MVTFDSSTCNTVFNRLSVLGKADDFSSTRRVESINMDGCRVVPSIIIRPLSAILQGGWLGILAQYLALTVWLDSWAYPCYLSDCP
jgi:hypothetical protein